MSYLDELRAFVSEKRPEGALTEPTKGSSVSFVSGTPQRISELSAREQLRDWPRHLSALDFDTAPSGFDLRRWRQLCEDAWWLFEGFGSQLVREGWSAHDVFGVLPWRSGGGVLLDRLHGSRNLKLDGEGRAFWSWPYSSVVMRTSRGLGDRLVSSGLVLVWDMGA